MSKQIGLGLCALAAAVAVLWVACGGGRGDANESGPANESGLTVSVDVANRTECTGFRYAASRVPCFQGERPEPFELVRETDFEDLTLPGRLLADVRGAAQHAFADEFFGLPAGCYDVSVEALDTRGTRCGSCPGSAEARGARVFGQLTTEVLLALPCGDSAQNHAPSFEKLTFEPSKFLFECEAAVVCATVRDPDGDPLELAWTTCGGRALLRPIDVVSTKPEDGGMTQCVDVVPDGVGELCIEATAYDLVRDAQEDLVRAEHTSLRFPLHVNRDVALQCVDVAGDRRPLPRVRTPRRVPGCEGMTAEQFFCNPARADVVRTCPDGVFDPAAAFPACR